MKRILPSLGLALAMVFAFAPTALAGSDHHHWTFDRINFRTNRDGSFVDSTYVTANITAAAHSATAQSDTTVPYELSNFPVPDPPLADTSVVDSLVWFGFYIGGAGTSAPTADSVLVGQQVSIDGITWVTATNTQTFFAADAQVTGKPPIASAAIIEPTAGNSFGRIYQVNHSVQGLHQNSFSAGAATLPNDGQLMGWRYIRWVVTWSIVDGASTFAAFVGHWTD